MPGEATQVLAEFVAKLRYEDISQDAREHCKAVLLDTLACALAGHKGEETHQVAGLASALAQSDEASVIGGDRLSLAQGRLVPNGHAVEARLYAEDPQQGRISVPAGRILFGDAGGADAHGRIQSESRGAGGRRPSFKFRDNLTTPGPGSERARHPRSRRCRVAARHGRCGAGF